LNNIAQRAAIYGTTLDVVHKFSSEHPKARHCIRFLQDNVAPDALYIDMFARGKDGVGPTVSGSRQGLPTALSVYVSGSECQDISLANMQPVPLDLRWAVLDDPDAGKSSRAFVHSVLTLRQTDADVCILENVRTLPIEKAMTFLTTECPTYVWWSSRSNAADFMTSTHRERVYIVGIKATKCVLHPSKCVDMFEQVQGPRQASRSCDFLLPPGSTDALAADDCEQQRASRKTDGRTKFEVRAWHTMHKQIRTGFAELDVNVNDFDRPSGFCASDAQRVFFFAPL
jgi:site-specific DNA-cytosine methylase